ncbi:MAG: glutamate--cysteine ligase [Rhodoferax sp.]|nr:glutamate--cysteine ligase [Rhodoferax sp.]
MNRPDAPASAYLQQRIDALAPDTLKGIRRGIEKESLRAKPDGSLALTPHPAALGSALTHPNITTDFSESQVELITGVHQDVEACLTELKEVHQFTYRALAAEGDEMLWVSSMPCGLPTDETIPLGRYGSSNVGRAKSVYRMGLGHRYGRRMQTISGIHYNWSLPGVSSEDYFSLIRNFRRHAFLLLYLFGASPAVCSSFVAGRDHELQPLNDRTMYMPHGTSLRMGRLGYQSDAQASLAVSYNSLDGYGASLQEALTRPYPAYAKVGVRNPGGDYNQLGTTLLQIENEFYGTIRPKRVIFPGERPLHALRERGVEYVEVRLLDLDPFEPIGINAQTMRFIDVFLLHCLLSDSPPDSPEEIAALARNQHRVAARGREPGLKLERGAEEITLTDWGQALVAECAPIAAALDAAHGGTAYTEAVRAAVAALHDPDSLASARVLKAMQADHGGSFIDYTRTRAQATREALLAEPLDAAQQARFEAMTVRSLQEQKAIEDGDTMPFDIYLTQYLSPARLGLKPREALEKATVRASTASVPVAAPQAH